MQKLNRENLDRVLSITFHKDGGLVQISVAQEDSGSDARLNLSQIGLHTDDKVEGFNPYSFTFLVQLFEAWTGFRFVTVADDDAIRICKRTVIPIA